MTSTLTLNVRARIPRLAALFVLTLALVGVMAACGDDDAGPDGGDDAALGGDDADYIASLASALAPVNEGSDELDELRAAVAANGADAGAADAFGAAYETHTAARRDAIASVTPTEDLEALHAGLLAAAEEAAALAVQLHAELVDAPPVSDAEFQALLFDLDIATTTSRYGDACTALQTRANASGLESDLGCLQ
jgi:hypothetical protein